MFFNIIMITSWYVVTCLRIVHHLPELGKEGWHITQALLWHNDLHLWQHLGYLSLVQTLKHG